MEGSRVSNDPNIYIVVKVHSLNQYSKGKGVYYGYGYGKLHVVGMLTGMTTTIINGACGIGINAGHRTNN